SKGRSTLLLSSSVRAARCPPLRGPRWINCVRRWSRNDRGDARFELPSHRILQIRIGRAGVPAVPAPECRLPLHRGKDRPKASSPPGVHALQIESHILRGGLPLSQPNRFEYPPLLGKR